MKVTHNGQECDVPQWALETAYNNGYAKGYADGKSDGVVPCKECDIHGKCSIELLLGNTGFCSSGKRRTDNDY